MSTITKTTKNFEIDCRGLKPSTVHKFFYEGVDNTDFCRSDMPGEINKPILKTDASGQIKFRFALPVEEEQDRRNFLIFFFVGWNYWLKNISGNKKFELRATNSSAIKTVLFADL